MNKVLMLIKIIRGFFFKFLYSINVIGFFSFGSRGKIRGGKFITISQGCSFGNNCWLEAVEIYQKYKYNPEVKIGNDCIINDYFHLGCTGFISIGDDVLIGSNVLIIDHNHGVYNGDKTSSPNIKPNNRELSVGHIEIGKNVWIGDKVSIIGDVSIGDGCIIAANSVVISSFPENVIIGGNPAKVIKYWNDDINTWIK